MAAVLTSPPRNLADPSYMATRSDQQLFDVLSQGGAALGLSAAMPAYGNQLTAQQLWDLVAYVRALATPQSAAASPGSLPATTPAPVADLTITRLRLSIWPEYDDPRVLIMLRGEMAPRQAFPTQIILPLPKDAEIIGAGMISEHNELLMHPYQVLPGDTQDTLQLNLPAPRFFLEFYYNPWRASATEKRFAYAVPTTYPIEVLEVDVQQPLKATDFRLDPPPMERLTDTEGFTYHSFAYRDIKKNQTHTFTIAYTKTVATPSVPRQSSASPPARGTPIALRKTLLSLGILAGAVMALAGWAWLWRGAQRQPIPDASPASQATPASDALLALLHKDAEVPEAAEASPLPPPRVVNFCTQCGRKVLPDDRFCSGCGKLIKR